MSAPRASSVSSASRAPAADVAELDKTFRVDSLSMSVRGWTSGTEDVSRVLHSEREYWSQKCIHQVGDEVEKAMQEKAEALESRAVEKAKDSLRPFIHEVVSELQGKISRSLHQELEVQRVEWEATAFQVQKDRQAQAEAALLAAREEVEARYSARLDAMQATIGRLCGELREQRQEIAALSGRLERLDPSRCGADRGEVQELAPAVVHKLPPVALPPAPPPSGAEMPRLLGRGRAPSPVRSRHPATCLESSAGLAMPDGLKESLMGVVNAVQRTLDDFEEDPQPRALTAQERAGAPGPDEQDPVPSCVLLAPPVQAALYRAPAQQPRGAQAAAGRGSSRGARRPLVPPLPLVAVHQARQVLVQTPRTARGAAPLISQRQNHGV